MSWASSNDTILPSAGEIHTSIQDEFNPYAEHDSLQTKRELVSHDFPGSSAAHGPSESVLYLGSLVLLTTWALIIVAGIVLLEMSVTFAARSVSQPWFYTELPTLFVTVFTQAHAPITAVHLARLAMSSLDHLTSAPRSYVEVFWLSDRAWQGPIGMASSAFTTMKLRRCVSSTFLSLTIVSIVALVTPFFLSRAYPISTLDVQANVNITPSAFSPEKLSFNWYLSSAVGMGAAITGLSVLGLFNNSIYMPVDATDAIRDNTSDFFFAGDLSGLDTTLPGIRMQGGCRILQLGEIVGDSSTEFTQDEIQSCVLPTSTGGFRGSELFSSSSYPTVNANITLNWCLNMTFKSPEFEVEGTFQSLGYEERALGWIRASNSSDYKNPRNLTIDGPFVCETNLTFGQVPLNGRDRVFDPDEFQETTVVYNKNDYLSGPLVNLFSYLQSLNCSADIGDCEGIANALNLVSVSAPHNLRVETYRNIPTMDELVSALWRTITAMAAAIATLAQSDDTSYPATLHTTTTGRTRHTAFFIILLSLLGTWLASMVYLTVRLFRPTYSPSLDSYVAGRLLAENPSLLGDSHQGGASQSSRLWARYRPSYVDADTEDVSLRVAGGIMMHPLKSERNEK